MKAKIIDITGKEKGTIELPSCFSGTIREDIVAKVLEAKKVEQPYSPSPVAGKQHSASGVIIHQRKVWKSGYGRGQSRVPRKVMSNKGSQFNWVGAEVSNTRGGRRPHPPKVIARLGRLKINKKELKIALLSCLSASVDSKIVLKKYSKLKNKKINAPFVVEDKITTLKAKELLKSLKSVLGDAYDVAIQKKQVRAGKGKLRGRKYKSNAGMVLVIGNKEKLKTSAFDVVSVKHLGVNDLAKGGIGRLTVYTESAIKELGEKLK